MLEGRIDVTSNAVVSGGTIQSGGTVDLTYYASVSNTTVNSGGALYLHGSTSGSNLVLSGGSIALSGADVTGVAFKGSNGVLTLSNGGNYGLVQNSNGTALTNGNTINVNGGLVVSQTIGFGGTINVYKGAVSAATLDGGTLYLGATSASLNTITTSNGGTVIFGGTFNDPRVWGANYNVKYIVSSGAILNSTTVSSGASVTVMSGGTWSGPNFVNSGGNVVISSGAVLSGIQTVSSGGTMVLNGTAGTGVISLAGDGAHLVISGTSMPTNVISNWSPSDTIELASIPRNSVTQVVTTANGVTFYTTGGTYTLNVPGANTYGYELKSGNNGDLIYTTCFAEGTLIRTPEGTARVEALKVGHMVTTPKGDMPVKWMGHRAITVSSQPVPEENWLVRIRENALADGVPSRDLLVTQEHCMVFEGKLVPARMLVNGSSILLDRTLNSYTYYHVELESHEALWAEDALTESYLDTGNRDQFENNTVTALFGGAGHGAGSDSLPLDTSRAFVAPIYAAIAARAGVSDTQLQLTEDADMHLMTDLGQRIRPLRQAEGRVMFMIPAGVSKVRLMSRANRPSDVIGPFVDDRRTLGVLIGDISLQTARTTVALTAHLTDTELSGWHEVESPLYRWTNGDAMLVLDNQNRSSMEPSILSLQVVASGPYLKEQSQTDLRQAG
ncbi:outer membrane protein [Acetobacter cibinongensis NRIC 0482]|nr:outer membrane protein [Acetobacter cibinongensis NRIC 0482]